MRYGITISVLVLGLAIFSASVTLVPVAAQQPTVQRKILITQDLHIPGYQVVMAAVEIPPGFRSGRHTHPGTVVATVQEGVLTLEHEGRPTASYKPGEALTAEAGKIHEDINNGTTPVKLIAAYVIEKGKPLDLTRAIVVHSMSAPGSGTSLRNCDGHECPSTGC